MTRNRPILHIHRPLLDCLTMPELPGRKRIDVAIGIVHQGGRILICQRLTDAPLGGYWEFPGGKCEPGESPADCLHRELREELAITVTIAHTLTPIQHDYPHALVRLHPFLCDLADGTPHPHAAQQLKWITPDQLPDHPFPPANDALFVELAAYLQRLSGAS